MVFGHLHTAHSNVGEEFGMNKQLLILTAKSPLCSMTLRKNNSEMVQFSRMQMMQVKLQSKPHDHDPSCYMYVLRV